jgi:hypothetical protein
VFENMALRRIFGQRGDEVTGGFRKLNNEELHPDHVGFCDGQKWRWGKLYPRTSVSSANLHSICFSTIIFTITRGGTIGQEWPQCQ